LAIQAFWGGCSRFLRARGQAAATTPASGCRGKTSGIILTSDQLSDNPFDDTCAAYRVISNRLVRSTTDHLIIFLDRLVGIISLYISYFRLPKVFWL
jgi:hypothetical protein